MGMWLLFRLESIILVVIKIKDLSCGIHKKDTSWVLINLEVYSILTID
jgi:hypothetical protein